MSRFCRRGQRGWPGKIVSQKILLAEKAARKSTFLHILNKCSILFPTQHFLKLCAH